MFGINIHEFLKFFSLQFPTKNIEIAFKVCNFLFAHPPPISTLREEKMPNYRFLKSPELLPSHFILLSPIFAHLPRPTKKLIISYVLIPITRRERFFWAEDFCDRTDTHLQTRGFPPTLRGETWIGWKKEIF